MYRVNTRVRWRPDLETHLLRCGPFRLHREWKDGRLHYIVVSWGERQCEVRVPKP